MPARSSLMTRELRVKLRRKGFGTIRCGRAVVISLRAGTGAQSSAGGAPKTRQFVPHYARARDSPPPQSGLKSSSKSSSSSSSAATQWLCACQVGRRAALLERRALANAAKASKTQRGLCVVREAD
ncbi:hypothetical protein HPB50_027067 [Hyalomma asiaticum]|uniref:Uncharacterized protein n=1 Tax=Hyalomma asiaticum TaxID=266040 RepID=A0ACB7RTJ4_HYAAI|nr:hypothetical protein HPB50_027067 [Hyalomma asiaticum]